MSERIFYFGCSIGSAGHFLHSPDKAIGHSAHTWRHLENFPLKDEDLDGGFCPAVDNEGSGSIRFVKGWTILAIWDRSEDSRAGSHSTYLAEGKMDVERIKVLAKLYFPKQWLRLRHKYPILSIQEGGESQFDYRNRSRRRRGLPDA